MTRVRSILYHDVAPAGDADRSGFPGAAAGRYKLEPAAFAAHLDALGKTGLRAVTVHEIFAPTPPRGAFLLTVDDGGVSAWEVAGLVEARGWRAHFFVTTDALGTPTFLDAGQVRELRRRGHVIGSHSATHPTRMARLGRARLEEEWRRSLDRLRAVLGEPVDAASVPGGYYARPVAEAAAAAGAHFLFTSEPTARVATVDACRVLGRYTVWRGMPPAAAAGFITGAPGPCWRQFLFWNAKKIAKAAGGRAYLELRERMAR